MSFVLSIGPSHPISEIGTSHIYRFKKTRNEDDQKFHAFLIKRVRHSAIYSDLSVKWLNGCSEGGDHKMYQK